MERVNIERIRKRRPIWLLVIVFAVLFGWFGVRLYQLQSAEHNAAAGNLTTYFVRTRVRADRGDILDTNGNVLVTNRASYNLVLNH